MATIDLTREDDLATVTMSNPDRKNALAPAACETMAGHLADLAHDDSVRCVILRGDDDGDAFCSGIDLAAGMDASDPAEELEGGLNAIARHLLTMEKPAVAAVDGPAVGAGASIATACDFVYVADSAGFAWGFTDIGLAPDTGATYVLPRLVGVRRAMELLATGERVDAERAVDLGIANAAYPGAAFEERLAERVDLLASRPTRAVGAAKRLVLRNSHRSVEEALAAEARAQSAVAETADFSEGIQAFVQGRDPEFEGR